MARIGINVERLLAQSDKLGVLFSKAVLVCVGDVFVKCFNNCSRNSIMSKMLHYVVTYGDGKTYALIPQKRMRIG